MKRFIVFLLVILMIVPLCGCMGGEEETTTPSPTTTAPTTAVPPTESPEKSYSMLQINEVNESNNKIIVRGVSDLPDGSSLIVGVELAGLAPSDTWIGTSDKTTVQDGSFEIELDVLNHPKFANGPYVAYASFTPKNQEPHVIDLVGENGENLTGDYLVVDNWNMLEYETDNIMLDLNIRTDYPMVSISDYQVDTPERALAEFLTAWEEKDWEEMANHTQLTWRARLDDPADVMRARSEFEELYGAEIMNITYVSDVTADVEFKIYFDFLFPTSKDIQTETHVARIIKEDAPYSPSIEGT